mmetsp:Transcript_91240/g.254066  ORF Transcript_91240/g.254066 Transcript_91240/m.254066 type:complete len:288 (-) Transcript_91240:806-1669(-)
MTAPGMPQVPFIAPKHFPLPERCHISLNFPKPLAIANAHGPFIKPFPMGFQPFQPPFMAAAHLPMLPKGHIPFMGQEAQGPHDSHISHDGSHALEASHEDWSQHADDDEEPHDDASQAMYGSHKFQELQESHDRIAGPHFPPAIIMGPMPGQASMTLQPPQLQAPPLQNVPLQAAPPLHPAPPLHTALPATPPQQAARPLQVAPPLQATALRTPPQQAAPGQHPPLQPQAPPVHPLLQAPPQEASPVQAPGWPSPMQASARNAASFAMMPGGMSAPQATFARRCSAC